MTDRPIIMSGESVRAILAGRKTQTRRVVEPMRGAQSRWCSPGFVSQCPSLTIARMGDDVGKRWAGRLGAQLEHLHGGPGGWIACPHGEPGDRLYVKEAVREVASGEVRDGYGEIRYGVAYRADGAVIWAPGTTRVFAPRDQPNTGPMQFNPRPWGSPIHMRRSWARLTLEITSVRVERVQAITEADARAEGLPFPEGVPALINGERGTLHEFDPRRAFGTTWEAINGRRPGCSWAANPWVWVLEFRRVEDSR